MMDENGRAKPGDPINLAETADFAVGGLLVRPSLRKIEAGVQQDSVEPRVMQALVALVQAGGSVVSRDVLIERCWRGRIVGDDAINRCIAKVRRLADSVTPPAFVVETVSKVGYRLHVPEGNAAWVDVTAADDPTGGSQKDKVETRRSRRIAETARRARAMPRWTVQVAAAVIITTGAGAAFWRLQPAAKWTVVSNRSLPRLDDEGDPRLSPNGSMLAYSVNEPRRNGEPGGNGDPGSMAPGGYGEAGGEGRIYVRNLLGGAPLAVSLPGENAASPAWASDGVHLAYVVSGQDGAPCRIMVTTFPGGTPVQAGECRQAQTTQIAWQPGSPYLFLEDRVPVLEGQLTGFFDAIFRMNIETGASEQVTSPPQSDSDYGARVSPDGAWVAYIRNHGLSGQALRLRRIAGSEERELACDPDVNAIDWAPDGKELIASVPGQMGGEIRAYPINGTKSYRIYASAAGLGGVAVGQGGIVAAEIEDGRHNLARASKLPRQSADFIDTSPGMTDWPAFSRDGTLAFVSSRSGEMALWTRKPGAAPTILVSGGLNDLERPVWSPDGTRIAFIEIWKGDITVRVVTAQGQNVVSFEVPSVGYGMPNWTPDGEHLLVFDKRILQAVSVDLRNASNRIPVEDKFWDGTLFHDGAVFTASGIRPGIWQLEGEPGHTAARLITPNYPPRRRARLAFLGHDVLLPDAQDSSAFRIRAQPLSGGQDRVAFYAPGAEPGTPIAVDPLTGDVIYVGEVAANSHIDVLKMVRQ